MISKFKVLLFSLCCFSLSACNEQVLNNPYPDSLSANQSVLYSSFSERPRHLDPAKSYSSNEYVFFAQIYESPFQYHFLKRPYELEPLTATRMPEIIYLDSSEKVLDKDAGADEIAFSDYIIEIKPEIYYQSHPALVKNKQGQYLYHHLTPDQLAKKNQLSDFNQTGTRELTAADYVHENKRLVHPQISSPIAELMKQHIVGLGDYAETIKNQPLTALNDFAISGVEVLDKYRYKKFASRASIRSLSIGWQCHFLRRCHGKRMLFIVSRL